MTLKVFEYAVIQYAATLMTPEEKRAAIALARAADDGDLNAHLKLKRLANTVLRTERTRNTALARTRRTAP
jgi:hypothetical protein